jgi:hypothetical protein
MACHALPRRPKIKSTASTQILQTSRSGHGFEQAARKSEQAVASARTALEM